MITLTKPAAEHMQQSLSSRGKGVGIRVGVRTTGCSGYAYLIEYADKLVEGDIEFNERGISLIVNRKDLVYLYGLEIDYQKNGINEGLEFKNPNEKARCGCGESFSV